MHIAEGVLSAPVLGIGVAGALAGVAVGLRRLDYERVPRVAVLASAFFVASLVHVPIPPSSAHLVLTGLTGLILGWAAFPAVLVALTLQAVFFGFGGVTSLGANTVIMGAPAVVCYHLFSHGVRRRSRGTGAAMALGFAAGALGIALSGGLAAVALFSSGREFTAAAGAILVAHLPIMAVEGVVTAHVVAFLRKVRPELLEAPVVAPVREEAAGA